MSTNHNKNNNSSTSWTNIQNSYIDPSSIIMTNTTVAAAAAASSSSSSSVEGRHHHGHGVYNNIHNDLYKNNISNNMMYQQQHHQQQRQQQHQQHHHHQQQQHQQQQQPQQPIAQTERYSVLPVGHGNFLKVYHTHDTNEQQSFNNYELFSNNSFMPANPINKSSSLLPLGSVAVAATAAHNKHPQASNINYNIKKNYNDSNENTTNMIINQLVTNWSPNLTGTYSPFGEQPKQRPHHQQQQQQQLQQSQQQSQHQHQHQNQHQQQQQLQQHSEPSLNNSIISSHNRNNFVLNSNENIMTDTINQQNSSNQSHHSNRFNNYQQSTNLIKAQQQLPSSKTNGNFENNSNASNATVNNAQTTAVTCNNTGQNFEVKKRIIAEVKPMRMSYSDVLSKNVNTKNGSNNKINTTNTNGTGASAAAAASVAATTATMVVTTNSANQNLSDPNSIQLRNKNLNEKNKVNDKKVMQSFDDKDKFDVNKQQQQRKYETQKNDDIHQSQQSQQQQQQQQQQQHNLSSKDKKNNKDDSQSQILGKNKKNVSTTNKSKQKNSQFNNINSSNSTDNTKKRNSKRDLDDDDRTNTSNSGGIKNSSLNNNATDKENLYNITKNNDYNLNSSNGNSVEKKSQYINNNSSSKTSSKSSKFQSSNSSIPKSNSNNSNNGNNIGGNGSGNQNNNNSNSGRNERQLYSSSKRNHQKHQKNVKYDLISKFFEKWLEYTLKIISWLFYLIYDIIVLGFSMLYERLYTFYGILYSYFIILRNDFKNNSNKLWIKNLFKRFDNKFKKNSKFAFWRRFYKRKQQEQVNDFYKNGRLPQTGDEAMYSLLNCKGKDAYSILGVTADSSQEQIRKHYKKIAVLVHPDKNKQPGAEEAFKVLQRAFELIGEPENRKKYDQSLAEALNAEKAWTELHDLLSQLQSKIAEAANTIRCSSCGLRHPRKLTERPHYAARECSSCKIRHSAREGDIWAETSIFGLRWKYLALMEGKVYDITEWANCQKGALSQLQPNSHVVQYRIVRGGQQQQQQHQQQYHQQHQQQHQQQQQQQMSQQDREKLKKDIPCEPSLDEFLDNLYSGQNPQNQQNSSRRRSKRN